MAVVSNTQIITYPVFVKRLKLTVSAINGTYVILCCRTISRHPWWTVSIKRTDSLVINSIRCPRRRRWQWWRRGGGGGESGIGTSVDDGCEADHDGDSCHSDGGGSDVDRCYNDNHNDEDRHIHNLYTIKLRPKSDSIYIYMVCMSGCLLHPDMYTM